MQDPLAGLNPEQRTVVTTTEGPVLVLAGAGSGKTRALTHRLAYLITTGTATPDQLLAVTFTNKAAKEMRHRLTTLVGPALAPAITCSTFHSLGARLLREQWQATSRSQTFTILDTSDSERLLKQILQHHNVNSKQWSPRTLRHAISKVKNSQTQPEDAFVAEILAAYQRELARHNSYDFDDLVLESLALLQNNEQIRRHYCERWQYISIDEYQDTNPAQEAIIRQFLGAKPNLCVVGDDYQAIYSWRGAEVNHILRFEQHYPDCTTIYLTQNYRSTSAILSAANAVIAENVGQKHKQLWTERSGGTPVSLIAVNSDREEAQVVRSAIERYRAAGGQARDCAILYRTNAQSRLFEEALIAGGVPYTIVGGLRFYDRAEIKDALALIHLVVNPKSSVALQRIVGVLIPGVGPKTITKIQAAAETSGRDLLDFAADTPLTPRQRAAFQPLVQAIAHARTTPENSVRGLLASLLDQSGYRRYLRELPDGSERLENIEELLTVADSYRNLMSFIEEAALLSSADSGSAEQDQVLCMTLHAAKGLEFTNVWLVGCEEGLLPHINSLTSTAELEEERRLLYVGMTRAREHLTILYATTRALHGQQTPQLPSRFLEALPADTVNRVDISSPSPSFTSTSFSPFTTTSPTNDVSYSTYDIGDVVSHPAFGRGIVIQTQNSTVTAVFEGHGVKTFSAENVLNDQ